MNKPPRNRRRRVARALLACLLCFLTAATATDRARAATLGAAHPSSSETTTGMRHEARGVGSQSGVVTEVDGVEDAGAQLYRRGEHAAAAAAWTAAFDAATTERERARLAFNLGNAAYRRGAFLEAVGWYRVSLARAPRSASARRNLALARAEAGLAPADGGNLTGALLGAIGAFTAAEAGWLALLGLGLLTVGILVEAFLGGARGRLVLLIGALLACVALGPWVYRVTQPGGSRALVIESDGLTARSEPAAEGKRMAKLPAGSEVMVEDSYLDWRRVRTSDGEFWVPHEGLFVLR